MKVVLFDLGNTLECDDVLLPGAMQTLEAIHALRDGNGDPVAMGLVSDFDMPGSPGDLPGIREDYLAILDALGIRHFFEPAERCVTLSSDVGFFKPDRRVFRKALDRFAPEHPFSSALFVTENSEHVKEARKLGMIAVHFKGPGESSGEILHLSELVPLMKAFVEDAGLDSVRFGDEVFHFASPGDGARLSGASRGSSHAGALHLVVQKSKRFQERHPEIPVLYNRGRFLVVSLNEAQAAEIGSGEATCYGVQPLGSGQVAFERRQRGDARVEETPWITALVDRLARESYEADLTHLVSFPTRHSTTSHYLAAAEWCLSRLAAMGYEVTRQTIGVGAEASLNIIADRPGQKAGQRGVVLVTAHLDSVNHDQPQDPLATAPGADDNGSGSAGVLRIAEALRDHPNAEDLRFILFGGEEQGLFGSKHYVAGLGAGEKARILAVVNMDMIACLNRSPASVLLEGAALSQAVIDGLAQAAESYTGLSVETSLNPFASDHVPFLQAGVPAVLTIEGADQHNTHEHSPEDTLEIIDYDLALEILRMNLAFVAARVGRHDPAGA